MYMLRSLQRLPQGTLTCINNKQQFKSDSRNTCHQRKPASIPSQNRWWRTAREHPDCMWQRIAIKRTPKGQWFCPDCKKLPQFSLYLPLPIAHKIKTMLHTVPQQQLLYAPCPVLSMHSLHHMLVGIQLGRPPTSMTQIDLTVGVQSGWLTATLFLREKVELIIRMLGVQSWWLTPTLFLRETTECWASSLCDQGNVLFLKIGKFGTQFSWL